mgnify:CR=1 FL=1
MVRLSADAAVSRADCYKAWDRACSGAKNGWSLMTQPMDALLFASAVAPKGLPVILPALAGAGILVFLSQLFVPKT